MKPIHWVAVGLGVAFALWIAYSHLQYFGNISFLGGVLLLELIIACLWKFDRRYFAIVVVAFAWSGMRIPFQDAWTGGRWLVLAVGAVFGYIIWMKEPRSRFRAVHLLALFCVIAAFVSASVSPFVQMASYKALSLLLLFLYCTSGARAAVLGREERFFQGLLWGCELATYGTAVCYLVLGQSIWGNPNSLGAVMSVAIFPILLWGWLVTDASAVRLRRLVALLLCVYLTVFSVARAGIVAMIAVTIVFSLGLKQYKLLIRAASFCLALAAVAGVFAPERLSQSLSEFTDTALYKGHKEEGVFGSRRKPWERTVESIKEHPWFGTGYGTSPSGEDPGLHFGRFSSSAETAREHGSSYITIAEWVGLLGLVPFAGLLALTLANLWRVCAWMRRTADPRHYAIPLAMVVVAGLVHAAFEDWLFAVGYYLCLYFWTFAFVLADLVPAPVAVSHAPTFARVPVVQPDFSPVAFHR